MKTFFNNLTKNWKLLSKNQKNVATFEKRFENWLKEEMFISLEQEQSQETTEDLEPVCKRRKCGPGRPKVSYSVASRTTKWRRHSALSNILTPDECIAVAKTKMKETGNLAAAKLLENLPQDNSVTSALKSKSTEMPTVEALELLVDADLTKASYNHVRNKTHQHQNAIYPSYYNLSIEKAETYPIGIDISETKCEVSLQNLLNHTVKRLCTYLELKFDENLKMRLILVGKYGFDGTNVNVYKQKAVDNRAFSSSAFCSSFVPLELIDENGNIFWKNSHPSSTRFCRPVRILFEKETDKLCRDEETYLKNQIEDLEVVDCQSFTVGFKMYLTMIDGKVSNALNNSSSQRCFVCKAPISHLNNIEEVINLSVNQSALKYGFSVLHAYIRFMELVLHISYRLDIKEWRISKDRLHLVNDQKKRIQDVCRKQLGILLDAPTQGSGNTNDGNTARTFFNNIDIISEVTGFDKDLLNKFKVILAVIASGQSINVDAFKNFCKATALRYVQIYPWYYLPPSMHIILIHGHEMIQQFTIPIGMLSEEPQESNHKNVKRYREKFTRKSSRSATNLDLFRRLMLNSDPLISLRNKKSKGHKVHRTLDDEMKNLLIIAEEAI